MPPPPRPKPRISALADGEKTPIKELPIDLVVQRLETDIHKGLTSSEAERRLQEFGENVLPEAYRNPFLIFLGFFWNPLSWAMETAAIISIGLLDYADFGLIIALLILNATIGYYEDQNAGNAVAALKSQLAPQSKALRDGKFIPVAAAKLVPGDIIRIRLGDVVPADVKLLHGDPVKIDQAALTGESLPVTKSPGDEAFSGSIVKQGEIEAVVYATGIDTFFGKAAALIDEAEKSGHLQSVLSRVGYTCLLSIFVWVIIELIVQFGAVNASLESSTAVPYGVSDPRYYNLYGPNYCNSGTDGCPTLSNIIVLIVGGIPIAMPTVLSVTMAIGALRLSKRNAIVSRLTAVEELAGMDILCSDKTGTLTLNKLSIDQSSVFPVGDFTVHDVMFDAALAARTEDNEPIDVAIVDSLAKDHVDDLKNYKVIHYAPFDPVSKRTIATIQDKDGNVFSTCKGAPQVILNMAYNSKELQAVVKAKIAEYAVRGFRALGVARSNSGNVPIDQREWEMVGLMPLYDPPRSDTAETIKSALSMGIAVKMITGDQLAIARETARQLGMSTDIHTTDFLNQGDLNQETNMTADELVEKADGFAEVFPQHKFEIVRRLQHLGHVCGMTGDGVNDAPALKQSDIGIAVAGATDAARAAADIVLVTPGLSVIIDAIIGARKIFQRMKNYATYSIAMTTRVTFTFGLLTCIYNWYFPTILVVIFAILNDGTMLTISKDTVKPSPEPDDWRLPQLFLTSFVYGLWLMTSTLVLFSIASNPNGLFVNSGALPLAINTYEGQARLRGLIYMQVSISGQALIFVTRSRGFSFLDRPHILVLSSFVIAQTVATIIGVYGFSGYSGYNVSTIQNSPGVLIWGRESFFGCGWAYALVAWIWVIIWYIPLDFIKFLLTYLLHPRNQVNRFNRLGFVASINFGHPFHGHHHSRSSMKPRII